MLTEFEVLMEAKSDRDRVRDQIVKALHRGAGAQEIAALLRADAITTEGLRVAQETYNQIHDSLTGR